MIFIILFAVGGRGGVNARRAPGDGAPTAAADRHAASAPMR